MVENILVIGSGAKAQQILSQMQETSDVTVADIFYSQKEKTVAEKKVANLKEVDFQQIRKIIIAKDVPMSINGVIPFLHDQKVREVFVCLGHKMLTVPLQQQAVLGYAEMHLVNHCNLNCRGCSHFANLQQPEILSVNHLAEAFRCLAQKFRVLTLRLMGGEPLLHPELSTLLGLARDAFPETRIELVTNGLLIPQMSQDFWKAIQSNGIFISVSNYQPTFKMAKQIVACFEANQAEYAFDISCKQPNKDSVVREFHKCLSRNPKHDPELSARMCFGKNCYFYHGFHLSKCAFPALIGVLNERFDRAFDVTQTDLHDLRQDTDGWEILRKLDQPMDFCKYCITDKPERTPWRVTGKPVPEDYIVCDK